MGAAPRTPPPPPIPHPTPLLVSLSALNLTPSAPDGPFDFCLEFLLSFAWLEGLGLSFLPPQS